MSESEEMGYNLFVPTLPAAGTETDSMMLHCCFTLLEQFIKNEEPKEFAQTFEETVEVYKELSEEEGIRRAKDWRSIKCLLEWWKERKKTVFHSESGSEDQDKRMLTDLVLLSGYYWT